MGVSLVLHPRNPYVPDGAHERALLRRDARTARDAGLVVRRRHGPDALLRLRGGRGALPPHLPRRARAVRRRPPSALQEVVRRVLLPEAPQRAARHRRHLLRRPRPRRTSSTASRLMRSVGDHFLPAYLPIVERRTRPAVRRARARLPGLSPRPLRRVQPGVRPRHAVRPAVGRPHRVDPDVAAAGGEVALRLAPGAGHARGAAVRDVLVPRDWV